MAARARKTTETAKSIAERAMPGWQATEPMGPIHRVGGGKAIEGIHVDAPSASAEVDAVMPSDQALHDKFFGAADTTDGGRPLSDAAPVHPADIELVE